MGSYAAPLEKTEPPEHAVQLYGQDDDALARNVGRYLADGCRRGDALLVIATPSHRQAFARQLRKEGVDAIEAAQEGRLVFLDAGTVLERIIVGGQPDWASFDSVVGGAVREARVRAGQARLRAFGELVALLWTSGQVSQAMQVEEYWNQLRRSESFSLYCAYPIDVLGPEFAEGTVGELLCAHTHLLPADRGLESALDRALTDVLGPKAAAVKPRVLSAEGTPGWGILPRAEATILWLRENLRQSVDEILIRARRYSQSLRSKRHPGKLGLLKTGTAARLLGTTTRTLLFYEEEGLVRPKRTAGGTRMYSEFDLSRAEVAIRLSRLGFPLKLIKQLALTRPGAASGAESSRQLAALFDDMRREIDSRRSALGSLAEDIERAEALVRECASCPNRPTRRTCPNCPCELNVGSSPLLRLTADPER